MKVVAAFPYKEAWTEKFGLVFVPVAYIGFPNIKRKIEFVEMLWDSGADITLIPKSFGEYLGFKIEKEEDIEELRGIAEGVVPVATRKVMIQLGEEVVNIRIGWALIEEIPLLLGRLDIIDKFTVELNCQDKMLVFSM